MHGKLMAAAFVLGALTVAAPAFAGDFDGGGGSGSGSGSDGDWAIRDELKNPRLIQPGSPYGYDRSYSRGPGPWPFPPAYQAIEESTRPGGPLSPGYCYVQNRRGQLIHDRAGRPLVRTCA
jgi:hypothetical protein